MEEKKQHEEQKPEENKETTGKKVVVQFRKLEKLETTSNQRAFTGSDPRSG